MTRVDIFARAGAFAENKDTARDIRIQEVLPALDREEEVVLDFSRVDAATQSFIHALISEPIRKHGSKAFDRIAFKSCNETIRKIIGIVADYMQEGT
ncbi:MAG: STAS-like domain-containing protein [Elusimicrobiota bacterium]